ncbi:MAG: polysaccharide deacetylase family protein [Alphaproteobacteria bacterium]
MPGLTGRLIRALGARVPASVGARFSRPVALVFHGVVPGIRDARVQTMHHRYDVFYDIVTSLKAHFDFLPLSSLAPVLAAPTRHPRTVFLMADDGYANNLTVAADILDELRIPWTLFASTWHIDNQDYEPFFLARLFIYFAPAGRYAIPGLPAPLVLGAENRESKARRVISDLRGLAPAAGKAALQAMLAAISPSEAKTLFARFASEKFLTWDQVRALHKRGVEVGAHAHWHWPMRTGNRAYVFEQAHLSRKRIESEVGPCRYFAYPFGTKRDINAEAWQAVRDAGFEYAFTTLAGTLDASANRWLMPRYTIGLNETNIAGMVPLLRAGNPRLAYWQHAFAA